MSVPVAPAGPMFGPLAPRSVQFIPRLMLAQTSHDVVRRHVQPPAPDVTTSAHDVGDLSIVRSDSGDDIMLYSEGDLPLSSTNTNRVLLNRNVAARHALKAQNNDLDRQFERVMAAHAAQQRILQAELRALQQCAPNSTGAATATAVDLSTVMSGQHHHQGASNGKYFVSPFNRHKARRADPSSSVTLPPPASSTAHMHSAMGEMSGAPSKTQVAMAYASIAGGTPPTTMATTSGLHVQTTSSPSLKLRQTASGGLKLQPVDTSQVTSALSTMKTQGGKTVRVKVQLKVKLPPLKVGQGQIPTPDPTTLQGQEVVQPSKKQVIRLLAKTAPREFSHGEGSKFSSLRKIDIVFAGERAASRLSSESAKGAEKANDNTLVLRCADGTLCRVPIGGTRKLQKLVATRDTILGEDASSGLLSGQSFLKSCLKKPPRTRSLRLYPKKTVRFAPDTLEVNRESRQTELQPTVKIGSQLYRLKLPSIKSVKRITPPTTDRYTVRAVSVRPKNKEDLARFKKDELESIAESEEGSSTMTEEDYSSVSSSSPESGKESPAARANRHGKPSKIVGGGKYTDMVLSVAMKKKKTHATDPKTPASSPVMATDGAHSRVAVSPTQSPNRYVVSKSQDRWKVTIKNT